MNGKGKKYQCLIEMVA